MSPNRQTETTEVVQPWRTSNSFIPSNAVPLDLKWWPSVSFEDDRIALKPEKKKRATENDHDGFCWEQTRETTDGTEKEDIKRAKTDLAGIPYPVQETCPPGENGSLFVPMTAGDSFEDETSPSDKCAEVKVEKLDLKVKESCSKTLFRRNAVRKVKRNVWCVVATDPHPVQRKNAKKTYKGKQAKKYRQPQIHTVKQSSVYDEAENTKLSASKRKKANNPAGNEPDKDSGHSENRSSGSSGRCSGGCSGGRGSSSGSLAGGSGSTGGSGGDDDDNEKKEFSQGHLSDHAAKKKGKKREKEDEKDEKGYVRGRPPGTNTTGSLLGNVEHVQSSASVPPGEGEPTTTSGKDPVPGEWSKDHAAALELAQGNGYTSVSAITKDLGWEADRAKRTLDYMVREGMAWIDEKPPSETLYWFPDIFLRIQNKAYKL